MAYLALEGPTSRKKLADLFWMEARDRRDSLSSAVSRINRTAPAIRLQGDRLTAQLDCDALDLLDMAGKQRDDEVLRLYAGHFLEGLQLSLSEELEEWVFSTGERITAAVRNAHVRMALTSLERGNTASALHHSEAALELRRAAALSEAETVELAAILQAAGSRRLPELRSEAKELGLKLETGVINRPVERVRLPRPGTTFVGRAVEQRQIQSLLSESQARLVTVHGPGGVGKSRLAIEVALHLAQGDAFQDGTFFVPLETVADEGGVATAVADAMQVPLTPQVPEDIQVISFLGDRKVLLVLDNFEHLTRAPLVKRILAQCPNTRLLVTSRQRLNHVEEHAVSLAGLPLGELTAEGEALQLLRERIGQRGVHDSLPPEDDGAARLICEQLEGFPLALELAAAWTDVMSLGRLAAELSKSLDILVSRDPDTSERRHSLFAAFDVSWRLLEPAEARALRRIAVFQGGFTTEAARQVIASDLATLTALSDKALIRSDGADRFHKHPLVREFISRKLAERPDEEKLVRDLHARYYLEAAVSYGELGMGSDDVRGAWGWFSTELANLAAAWQHAVSDPGFETDLLVDFAWYVSHFGEQAARYRDVLNLLDPLPDTADPRVAAEVMALCAWLDFRLGQLESSLQRTDRSLALLARFEPLEVYRALWSAHDAAMGVRISQGALREALVCASAAIAPARAMAEAATNEVDKRNAEIAWGITETAAAHILTYLGEFEEANRRNEFAFGLLAKHRSGGLVYAYHVRGQLDLYGGRAQQAAESLRQALATSRHVGFLTQEAHILADLAQASLALGKAPTAEALCRSGLSITTGNGNRWHETILRATLGRVLIALGNAEAGARELVSAARIALSNDMAPFASEALIGLAELNLRRGDAAVAASILSSLIADASAPAAVKLLARWVADQNRLPLDADSDATSASWLRRMTAHDWIPA